MTANLACPCSYKKESLLRIESTHIEFSKDLNRCLPSNIVHPVDGLYYTKARSGLIPSLILMKEGRSAGQVEEKGGEHSLIKGANTHIRIRPISIERQPLLRYGPELKLANIGQGS
ncbi:hypothetical protein L1887_51796 [Cichorium endivia]|nr:hypothetical protein L1887_51796 [Cichorium endivia]